MNQPLMDEPTIGVVARGAYFFLGAAEEQVPTAGCRRTASSTRRLSTACRYEESVGEGSPALE